MIKLTIQEELMVGVDKVFRSVYVRPESIELVRPDNYRALNDPIWEVGSAVRVGTEVLCVEEGPEVIMKLMRGCND